MNKVMLIGNLARDPEVRYSQSAEPVAICKFTIAVARRFKREGEADADFIYCVAFNKTGEFIEKYFKKGKKIAVSGRLSIRQFEDQNGQKKSWTEVIVEEAEFVDSKPQSNQDRPPNTDHDDYYSNMAASVSKPSGAVPQTPETPASNPGFTDISGALDDDDDELPF